MREDLARQHPAELMWNAPMLHAVAPEAITLDDRPDAPATQFWWAGDDFQVGAYWYAYQSRWIPQPLLGSDPLADALIAAAQQWNTCGARVRFERSPSGWPERLRTRAGGRVTRRHVSSDRTLLSDGEPKVSGGRTADPEHVCRPDLSNSASGNHDLLSWRSPALVRSRRGEPEGDRSKQTPGLAGVGSSTECSAATA